MKDWKEIDGWLFEEEGLALQAMATGKNVLEFGSWLGRSSVCIAQTARYLTCVDWFKGSPSDRLGKHDHRKIRREFVANTEHLNNLKLFTGTTESGMKQFDPNHFQFIFYDACHEARSVSRFVHWLIVNRYQGCLAFHDYGKPVEFPGTHDVVTRFISDTKVTPTWKQVGSLLLLENHHVAALTRSLKRAASFFTP